MCCLGDFYTNPPRIQEQENNVKKRKLINHTLEAYEIGLMEDTTNTNFQAKNTLMASLSFLLFSLDVQSKYASFSQKLKNSLEEVRESH